MKSLQTEFQMKLDEEKVIQMEEMETLQIEKCNILEEVCILLYLSMRDKTAANYAV